MGYGLRPPPILRATRFVTLGGMLSLLLCLAASSTQPPNLVFVLVDDLGWRDLGVTGSPVCRTPHLDAFAAEGMRFTQAYAAAPICSASRAAILTGKSPARLHFEFVTKSDPGRQQIAGVPLRTPPFTLDLPLEETTIAERLAGYRTAFFGKWHVSRHHQRYLGWSPTHGPRQQGFDVAVEDFGGHPYNSEPQLPPKRGAYPGDSLTDRAIESITTADGSQPFFLMVSHFYVHTPVKPNADWLVVRIRRDHPELPAAHVRYAAFVEILDHHVGRLLAAIDETTSGRETVVVITSDNGGDPRFTRHGSLRGHKWTLFEGGIRVPLLVRWPGVVAAGSVQEEAVIGTDLLPTFAAIAGQPLTAEPSDGVSLVPLLKDAAATLPPRPLVWHFPYYHPETNAGPELDVVGTNDNRVPFVEPHSAVRLGDMKTLLFHRTGDVLRFGPDARDAGESQPVALTDAERATAREEVLRLLAERDARLPIAE